MILRQPSYTKFYILFHLFGIIRLLYHLNILLQKLSKELIISLRFNNRHNLGMKKWKLYKHFSE
ncbi:hypothetical protein DN53_04740 [Flagellimonas olearia]|uniref:Uncharacterized protein n=1 Tax=Flagellimonas olearia TaxID=552546 RepID=A0A444VRQ8_9FLAO|nr:hypothetical protein DN53_04740 [Allomuricauda olearia]